MMNEQEQAEYLGMAAAIGRLTMALKNTEQALMEAQRQLQELKPDNNKAKDGSIT